jgi:hypothetical protein
MNKRIFTLIAFLISLQVFGQKEKMTVDFKDFKFIFKVDSNWRYVSYEEIELQNPNGLYALKGEETKLMKCLTRKESKKITEYPYMIVQIMEVPKGIFTKQKLIEQADSVLNHNQIIDKYLKKAKDGKDTSSIVFLSALKNSKNYFDKDQCTMTTQMVMNDGVVGDILVYNVTFFAQNHLASIKIYIKNSETDKYLFNLLQIIANSGFDKSVKLK